MQEVAALLGVERQLDGVDALVVRPVAGAAWGTAARVVGAKLAAVAGPALVAYGIDQANPALTGGDAGPITLATAAYLAAALLGGLLTAATVRASARVSQTIGPRPAKLCANACWQVGLRLLLSSSDTVGGSPMGIGPVCSDQGEPFSVPKYPPSM